MSKRKEYWQVSIVIDGSMVGPDVLYLPWLWPEKIRRKFGGYWEEALEGYEDKVIVADGCVWFDDYDVADTVGARLVRIREEDPKFRRLSKWIEVSRVEAHLAEDCPGGEEGCDGWEVGEYGELHVEL